MKDERSVMAESGAKLTGSWRQVSKILAGTPSLGKRMEGALLRANIANALLLVSEMKKGIKSQAPGGKAFMPLADSTKKAKNSSKALIDSSQMVNSITQLLSKDKVFVGLLRTATNKQGDKLANIGAIMEHGATIKKPSGDTGDSSGIIIIPPRPFVNPILIQFLPLVKKNYINAVASVF